MADDHDAALARFFIRLLVGLYPPAFRRAFGSEIRGDLEAHHSGLTQSGPMGRTRFWFGAVRDTSGRALVEWASLLRTGRYRDFEPSTVPTSRRWGMFMDGLMQDVRFGLRSLLRRPGFTLVAAVTLALGIGANTAIFSVVNGVLLRPLPFQDPGSLMNVWSTRTNRPGSWGTTSLPNLRDWQEQNRTFEAMAGYSPGSSRYVGLEGAEMLRSGRVTDGLLAVFHEAPALGRDIRSEDAVLGGPDVVMVGHGLWQQRLQGDADVIGSTLEIAGEPFEIIGVAPVGFDFPEGSEIWLPLAPNDDCARDCNNLHVIGRLHPGVSEKAALEDMRALGTHLEEAYPAENYRKGTTVRSLYEEAVGGVQDGLLIMLGAVGMVLLIACANVANLLLVRASARTGEVAVRTALGASRGRIVRQLLTETGLLALLGGGSGLALAVWTTRALKALAPANLPRVDEIAIDGPVLAFAALLVLLVAVVFGSAPTLRLADTPVASTLTRSGQGGKGASARSRFRTALLVGEVGLSLMLLLGAGLLIRSFARLQAVDLGFRPDNVTTFSVAVAGPQYEGPEDAVLFFQRLEARLASLPGVESVGSTYSRPLRGNRIGAAFYLLDRPAVPEGQEPVARLQTVTPGYFETYGIPVVRGRVFTDFDRHDAPPTVMISQRFADDYYPGEDPVGKRITVGISFNYSEEPRVVVGVVGDVRSVSLERDPTAEMYVPHAQTGSGFLTLAVRTSPGQDVSRQALQEQLTALDPKLPLFDLSRMEDLVSASLATPRFFLLLLGVFSGLAITLAAVGLYGVVAYSVSQRTREIGIRIALGATGIDVARLVGRQGVGPAAMGILFGVGGAWFASKLLRNLLYEVAPQDPIAFGGATALVAVIVVISTLIPARRASRIPPAAALREE